MEDITTIFGRIYPYFLGGIGGAGLTILRNYFASRIQIMKCYHVDDEVISRIPVLYETGEQHENIYAKEFLLVNTTNKDIERFKIIFEFDATSKILKHSTFFKAGKDVLRPKTQKKSNEITYEIKNFNRKDKVKFFFDIANITRGYINVTESDCLGFSIVTKDRRKAKKIQNSYIVTKEQILINTGT
jgi:hypothetical protein